MWEPPCPLEDSSTSQTLSGQPSQTPSSQSLTAQQRKEQEITAELANWKFVQESEEVPRTWYKDGVKFNSAGTGPQNFPEQASPVQIFQKLWKRILPRLISEMDTVIEKMVFTEDSDDDAPPIPTAEAAHVRPITEEMMLAWIGIWIYQTTNMKPEMREYWSQKDTWVKSIGGVFTSYWQWEIMFRALYHLPVEFLEWMEAELNTVFAEFWVCGLALCIDEVMKRFKGRSGHKVFEPSKPARFGLKYYALVDSHGYLYQFKQHHKGVHVVLYNLCVAFLSTVD